MKKIEAWTDGACSGNPGPGGYGAVLLYGGKRKELSAGFRRTTNNRMELLAVIEALNALKEPCEVLVHSDSKYIVEAMRQRWPYAWRRKNWRRKDGPASNPDLWGRLLDLCDKHHVTFTWVEGHAGIEEIERCDELATSALRLPDLQVDEAFEARADAAK